MVNQHINISVDHTIVEMAKEKGFNISDLTSKAIKDKLKLPANETRIKCAYCGWEHLKDGKPNFETGNDMREAEKEALSDGNEGHALDYCDPTALTWLANYDQWICNKCLKEAIRRISIC
jgi:hypothetical protein